MKGKSYSLRLGLMALVVVLIFGALGSLSLARDAFDDDYDDCPSRTRLDAVEGLAIDRTDEADEIRVSWDALPTSTLRSLGSNSYKARLTIIVDGDDKDRDENVALGDTSRVFDEIDFTKELTISVAVTLGDYVISDIAEVDFTSGMPAPSFSTGVRLSSTGGLTDLTDLATKTRVSDQKWLNLSSGATDAGNTGSDDTAEPKEYGSFYYLGFNDLFDNWYATDTSADADKIKTQPSNPKFRVGLVHGDGELTAGDADFENYRIVIEDSNGDLLGYQAETVAAGRTYANKKIMFGETTSLLAISDLAGDAAPGANAYFTNIRRSNQVKSPARGPYFEDISTAPDDDSDDLSYGNFARVSVAGGSQTNAILTEPGLYADPPVEYFDFPKDVFADDGIYTIKAWAEDDDSTRISPQASIELSVREQGTRSTTRYAGYRTAGTEDWRTWDASTDTPNTTLTVFGFSIQDE